MFARNGTNGLNGSRPHRPGSVYVPAAEGLPTRIAGRRLQASIKSLPLPTPERGQRVVALLLGATPHAG